MSATILQESLHDTSGSNPRRDPGPDAPAPVAAFSVWVVTDGKAGMENQCVGLARALGAEPVVKRIRARLPWRWLTPALWPVPLRALDPAGDLLEPPWPDVAIGSGRQSVAPMMALRRASGGRSFTVQIQDPLVPAARFDLLAVPMHDRAAGNRRPAPAPNVMLTRGALHHVTPEAMRAAGLRLAPDYADLPRPLVAVLLGGPNKHYRFSAAAAERLGRGLAALTREHGAGLVITPSRRTPPEALAILRDRLQAAPCRFWDGSGENPYLGMLGLADAIVVTGDSVSMTSEACATGKPVHVFDLDGHSAKFARFHAGLRQAGITRPFEGHLGDWRYQPLDDTARVAAEIRRRLGLRGEMPVAPPGPLS